jgi:hypothetical protein
MLLATERKEGNAGEKQFTSKRQRAVVVMPIAKCGILCLKYQVHYVN